MSGCPSIHSIVLIRTSLFLARALSRAAPYINPFFLSLLLYVLGVNDNGDL